MDALKNLHQAEASAREALADYEAYGHAIGGYALRDLLEALRAARGEAVVTVNRHMLAQLGPDRWIPATRPEYPLASTDVALFAAPPAAAVCAPDSTMGADSGHTCASLEQAQPAALAVPSEGLTVKEAWWAGARAALGLESDTPRDQVASAFLTAAEPPAPAQQPAAAAVSAEGVLSAVERAISKGYCPSAIEEAYEQYEAECIAMLAAAARKGEGNE